MPVAFQRISLVDYETATDTYSQEHLLFFEHYDRGKVDSDKIWRAGSDLLECLRKEGAVIKKTSDSSYTSRGIINSCLLEVNLQKTNYYPALYVAILGNEETPKHLIEELGISAVEEAFPAFYRDVGIKSAVRHGLAYDFSF
ncbi:MAG: hypothetical protein AABX73_01270, partial [Nanoarchaeota archaeon]